MRQIKAIIFDLDNCLAPAKEVGESDYLPAFDAMRDANNGSLSNEMLEKAFVDVWRHPLDWVATTYSFPDAMFTAGWDAFSRMRVNHKMFGYGDLDVLNDLPVERYIVTSGFRSLQESKIEALGIKDLFTGIYVDAIDEPVRFGKKGLFEKIMEEGDFTADQVPVVGDNCESEVAAGNQLGITTVQTLRPDVPKGSTATFTVNNLAELRDLYFNLINN